MTKHHLIISGTGRAGTTFLMQLLTALKFDTGFTDPQAGIEPNCHAGMEWDIRRPDAPYIIKSPWLCDTLAEVMQSGAVCIDRAIVPVRDLYAAAESRRDVTRRSTAEAVAGDIPGGLWHTDKPEEQEVILTHQLYKLLHALAQWDIPLTLLYFPRLIEDPAYLYAKLASLTANIPYEDFLAAFRSVVQPQLIHNFAATDGRESTTD